METSLRSAFIVAIAILWMATASSAFAGVPPQVCKDYFAPSGDSALADSYLRNHPGAGIDVCQTIAGPGDVYYAIEAPTKDADGICEFAVAPVYPNHSTDEETSWSTTPGLTDRIAIYPRRLYATLSDKECPKQFYAWYVAVAADLPKAEFRELYLFVRSLHKSRSLFEQKANTLTGEGRKAATNFADAFYGAKPPDSIRFTIDQSGPVISFIFYDAAFALHLRKDGDEFTVVNIDSAVTWPGPDF